MAAKINNQVKDLNETITDCNSKLKGNMKQAHEDALKADLKDTNALKKQITDKQQGGEKTKGKLCSTIFSEQGGIETRMKAPKTTISKYNKQTKS